MAKERKGEKKVATDFEAMLSKTRERQRAQTLAQKLLGKESRRKSAGAAGSLSFTPNNASGNLASRAGVSKKKRASTSALPEQPKSLAARIAAPGTRKAEKIAAALERSKAAGQANVGGNTGGRRGAASSAPAGAPTGPRGGRRGGAQVQAQQQQNDGATVASGSIFPTPPAPATGLSIRGLAGPYVVGAENFAEGTTAADIESAVAPIGGAVHSCKILKTRPIVVAEIMFESREGAERVVGYFNGKTADSRILNFYAKVGVSPISSSNAPSGGFPQPQPRQSAPHVIDGSHGFDDPMEMDPNPTSSSASAGNKNSGSNNGCGSDTAGGLYSDKIVPAQRRGRGFNSWSRGGGGGGSGRGAGGGSTRNTGGRNGGN